MVTTSSLSSQPTGWRQRALSALRRHARRVGLVLAAGAVVTSVGFSGAVLVPPTSPAAPPTATASPINLKVVNTGSRGLGICENWNYPAGQWTAKTCRDSATDTLGKNEKSKWKDTDAVKVKKGYRVKERIAYTIKGDTVYKYVDVTTCTHTETYYLKIQPTIQRHTRWLYYKRC